MLHLFNKFGKYQIMRIHRQKQTVPALRKPSIEENDRNRKQTNTKLLSK